MTKLQILALVVGVVVVVGVVPMVMAERSIRHRARQRERRRNMPPPVWRVHVTDTRAWRHVGRAYTGTVGELILRDPSGAVVKVFAPNQWINFERIDDTE